MGTDGNPPFLAKAADFRFSQPDAGIPPGGFISLNGRGWTKVGDRRADMKAPHNNTIEYINLRSDCQAKSARVRGYKMSLAKRAGTRDPGFGIRGTGFGAKDQVLGMRS